ncbi:MAG: flagellar protein FlgN [Oscillospiraceae bacterium]|jgi:t-SNARE complex subunit (syntaxin)|nr:flagellar protein FlgN [Oscillospiraceae bacterium]
MSDFDRDRLIKLLESKERYVKECLEITKKQREIVSAEDIDAGLLTSSLNERRVNIDKIEGLHHEINVLMQSYLANGTNEIGDSEIDALQSRIDGVITQIRELDVQSEKSIRDSMDASLSEAKRLNQNRRGIGAYGAAGYIAGPDYFDKKQ